MSDDTESSEEIRTTVEIEGRYEQIADLLGSNESEYAQLGAVEDDMVSVLRIVTRTGGATKSRIAEELPSDVAADLDSDAVIHVLRVLELYDLVELDGNTWRPGPALAE